MLPNVPMEMKIPNRVENFSGENLRTKIFRVPIKTEAIPIPIRTLPRKAIMKVLARAKIKAPIAPTKEKRLITTRGPIRSSKIPIGI